jgi:hypothetical protein
MQIQRLGNLNVIRALHFTDVRPINSSIDSRVLLAAAFFNPKA